MSFLISKKIPIMFITIVLLTFAVGFIYFVLGGYYVGSAIDTNTKECELVVLRTLKCLKNNEKLEDCIKTDKFGLHFRYEGKVFLVNEELYRKKSIELVWKGKLAKARTLIRDGTLYPYTQIVYLQNE